MLEYEIQDSIRLKKRNSEQETELERLEERFIKGEIKESLYQQWDAKYSEEIEKISQDLQKKVSTVRTWKWL